MDLGKIMIGLALVMLSAGMLVTPSGAAGCSTSCTVGCGSTITPADAMVNPYSPEERENDTGLPAPACVRTSHESTMTLSTSSLGIPLGKKPRTRMNDDHSMHIPGISSHRNVNNIERPGSATTLSRHCSGPALTPEYRGLQSLL